MISKTTLEIGTVIRKKFKKHLNQYEVPFNYYLLKESNTYFLGILH